MQKIFKLLFFNFLFFILLISISLFFLEIFLRLKKDISFDFSINFIEQELDMISKNSMIKYDEVIGYIFKPNIISDYTNTDKFGIRMNDNKKYNKYQKNKILAVGDSFTAGSGVKDNETWPAILEKIIETKVYNAGAGGWGVDQMYLRAENLIKYLIKYFRHK